MATPSPASGSAKKVSGLASSSSLDAERKLSEQVHTKLHDFLKQYTPSAGKGEKDMLQGRWHINLSEPIPDFNTSSAIAYTATDITDAQKPYIALVCEPGKVQRYDVIEQVMTIEHRAVLPLKAFGAVELSAGEAQRMVVIYERPPGRKLSELVNSRKFSHNPHYLLEHVLIPLITGLEHFNALGISHGLINPNNIYFDDHGAVLGPCVTEPCGFDQPYMYESIERMEAHPAGKGEGSTSQDYYALAVVLLYILHGPEHFNGFTQEALMFHILKDGAYHVLMRDREVPEIFYDFLRGTMTQSPEDRWGEKQLKAWLGGKRYNVLPPPPPADAVRPFEFKDIQVNNRRELAYLFAADWLHMLSAIQSNTLSHWVTVSLRNKELAEMIARLCRSAVDASGKNEVMASEMLSNIVLLLDPLGPLRIRQMGWHVEAINTAFAEMYLQKATLELQFMAKFVETNMINYWVNMQIKRKPEYEVTLDMNDLVHRVDRLRNCIRNAGFGFGLERMLYDLNPHMPCQSELFENRYVQTLPQLLRQLDKTCLTIENGDIMDRHIAAFIASKLQIQNEIRLNELSSIPALATSRDMVALYLLGLVQERVEPMRLPGLTHWFALRLLPLMDSIHSRTLRQKMKTMLGNLAPLGLTQKMADLLIMADYAEADSNGFDKALANYRKNAAEIISLNRPERLEHETHRMGLNLATMLSYAGLLFSVLYIIRGLT